VTEAGCEIWFYHLQRTSLDQALPELLDKTLAKGWRAVVRAGSAERIEHLDGWLWSYRDDSFLPHGVEGEANMARQPILLTTQCDNANQAQALFLIDGVEPRDLDGYSRCLVLFDGKSDEQLAQARRQWKALKDEGAALSYWKQGARGGWEKAA
jgi:DNA polymerase-3 subunit chi